MSDGLPFEVPRTPVGSAGWRFEDLRPKQAEHDFLVFRQERKILIPGAMFAFGGVTALALIKQNLERRSAWFEAIPDAGGVVIGLILLLLGVVMMAAPVIMGRVVFDRRRQTAFKRGGKVWAGGIPFRVIAAVQTCPGRPPKARPRRRKGTSAEPEERALEINLVLSSPAGERVNVIAGKTPWSLRADAQQLAAFLGVPLLDQVGEAGSRSPAS